jgi:ketosteroid isomerase-like protein
MYKFVSFLVLLSFGAACAQQAEEVASDEAAVPTVSTEADVAAIEAVQDLEQSTFVSGDASLPHLTDNAVLLPPDESAVVGIEAAQAWAAEFFEQATFDILDYTASDIIVAGDTAIERYGGSVTLTPTGGESLSGTFKGIHIYERQADGSWKMSQDIWNFDAPLTVAE